MNDSNDTFLLLSVRARNVLNNNGIKSQEQARIAILEGRLTPVKLQGWPRPKGPNIRCYGWKTHKEVCKWVGLPEPAKTKCIQICPHCGKTLPTNIKWVKNETQAPPTQD